MTSVARETARPGRCPDSHPRVARETAPPATATAAPNRGPDAVARETTGPGLGTRIALAPLRAYRRWVSPLLGARCRYYPTCSAYAEQAVVELGPLRGLVVALWRLLRCNPFSPGGLDPLESRRLFRSEGAGDDAEHREDRA